MGSNGEQRPHHVWELPPRIRFRTSHWSILRGQPMFSISFSSSTAGWRSAAPLEDDHPQRGVRQLARDRASSGPAADNADVAFQSIRNARIRPLQRVLRHDSGMEIT